MSAWAVVRSAGAGAAVKETAKPAISLRELMDEEYALKLQVEEKANDYDAADEDLARRLQAEFSMEVDEIGSHAGIGVPGISSNGSSQEESDLALALALSMQEQEKKMSQVAPQDIFAYEKYEPKVEEGEEEEENGEKEGDGGTSRRQPNWPRRNKNLKGQGGDEEIITKHDKRACGLRNVRNLEKHLHMQTNTGDISRLSGAGGDRLILSNRVSNTLARRMKRTVAKGLGSTVERDAIQTHAKGLDQKTRLIIQSLLNGGHIDGVNGVVRTGKEAIVYHAFGSDGCEYALKIFKTTLTEFKNRLDYVKGDHRFHGMQNLSHQNPRKVVKVWAEKEFKNLHRVHRCGMPSPEPLRLHENVILMSFIGANGWAAPQLREVSIKSQRKLRELYVECALLLQTMFCKAKIVHADFSEFNILYVKDGPPPRLRVIDVGQAVERTSPNAQKLLRRDCANITAFFQKRGLTSYILGTDELVDFCCNEGDDAAQQKIIGVDVDDEPQENKVSSKRQRALLEYAASLGKWVDCYAAERLVGSLSLSKMKQKQHLSS